MQGKVCRLSKHLACQYGLKFGSKKKPLQVSALRRSALTLLLRARARQASDCQTFTTLGAACINHSATATGFHANQKAMGPCAANFRGLVCAFHVNFLTGSVASLHPQMPGSILSPRTQSGEPSIMANFRCYGNLLQCNRVFLPAITLFYIGQLLSIMFTRHLQGVLLWV